MASRLGQMARAALTSENPAANPRFSSISDQSIFQPVIKVFMFSVMKVFLPETHAISLIFMFLWSPRYCVSDPTMCEYFK